MLKAEPPFTLDGYAPPSGRVIENLFDQLDVVAAAALNDTGNPVAAEQVARLLDHPRVVEFLAAIERGLARPGYRQELDYSQGAGILMPHLAENRGVSRILSARTRRQAAAGETEAAWRTAQTGLRFADSLRNEPILISQLGRIAHVTIAGEALRAVAEIAPPSAEDGATLETLLRPSRAGNRWCRPSTAKGCFSGDGCSSGARLPRSGSTLAVAGRSEPS